ncbi:hypothetical protein K377_01337 [Streptomyces sp. PsTaAH-137]|nr:hypothetical protein K377_01337 [Streptomyces sp. PsTaAH-137]
MPPRLVRDRRQDCGRLPWFAPFLRRAFFLRRRFDDMSTSQGVGAIVLPGCPRRAPDRLPGRTGSHGVTCATTAAPPRAAAQSQSRRSLGCLNRSFRGFRLHLRLRSALSPDSPHRRSLGGCGAAEREASGPLVSGQASTALATIALTSVERCALFAERMFYDGIRPWLTSTTEQQSPACCSWTTQRPRPPRRGGGLDLFDVRSQRGDRRSRQDSRATRRARRRRRSDFAPFTGLRQLPSGCVGGIVYSWACRGSMGISRAVLSARFSAPSCRAVVPQQRLN